MLMATRWGIATSSDSARYIRSARQWLGREPDVESDPELLTERAHFPPMYPWALSLLSLGGADPLAASRWLQAALLAANAIIGGEMVRRFAGSQPAGLFTAAGIGWSASSLATHTYALSEPLFIYFSLSCLWLLVGLITQDPPKHRWRCLVASGLLAGVGVLTRYAGWALVPAGAAVLLFLSKRPMPRRVLEAIVFVLVAAAGPVAWSVRNTLLLGSATNRVIAFHPVDQKHLTDLALTAGTWLIADEPRAWAMAVAGLIVSAVLIGAIHLAWSQSNKPVGQLTAVMLIFIAGSFALLIVSISLVDYYTPLDGRILSPVYAAGVVLAGSLVAGIRTWSPSLRVAAGLVVLLVSAWGGVRSALLVHAGWRDGAGFAHRTWRESPIIAALRDLPPDHLIYTNAPGAVYLLSGRQIIFTVPAELSASSTLASAEYPRLFQQMKGDLLTRRAVLVWLDRYGANRTNYPKAAELKKRLGLHPLARRKDGTIFDYVPPTTTSAPARQ